MKRILALFCLALTVSPLAAQAGPLHAHVAGAGLGASLGATLGLNIGGVIEVAAAGDFQDRWKRRREDRDDDNNGPPPSRYERDDRNSRGGEDRNDNRINRAISIASSRGRVLDAGQQSGSIFWVRVATDRGRVDLLVDTDSGRIIGER